MQTQSPEPTAPRAPSALRLKNLLLYSFGSAIFFGIVFMAVWFWLGEGQRLGAVIGAIAMWVATFVDLTLRRLLRPFALTTPSDAATCGLAPGGKCPECGGDGAIGERRAPEVGGAH